MGGRDVVVSNSFGANHDLLAQQRAPLVLVCCYNSFDDLAHQPRGTMVRSLTPATR